MSDADTFEAMWNIILSEKFPIDDVTNRNVVCVSCKRILVRPCKATCGCRLCGKCVRKQLCGGGSLDCNKEELVMSVNIFRDTELDDTISNIQVKCPNEFCKENPVLGFMNEHLRVCNSKIFNCPFQTMGCEKEHLTKEVLMTHLETENFQHSQLMAEAMETMQNEVNNLINLVGRLKEDSERKDNIIVDLKEEIENLKFDLQSHDKKLDDLKKEDIDVQMQVGVIKRNLKTVKDQVSESNPKSVYNITEVVKSTEETKKKLDSLTLQVRDLQIYEEKDFLWKINNFTIKKRDRRYMTSNTFYRDSYNLCMDVWFNGDHLGIDCCIMKGQYDAWATVMWPMCRTVTLSIINQATMTSYKTERFHYSTYLDKVAFNRPISEWNNGIGNTAFIRLEEILNTPDILVNDSIVVSCVIDVF